MAEHETTLHDIYVAGGAEPSEDGQSVRITQPLCPFEITLLVIPSAVEMNHGEQMKVTFDVLLDEEVIFASPMMSRIRHEAQITLPVNQVKIKKEDT